MKRQQLVEQTLTFATNPDAALAAYHQLGYHIEPNVLTPAECDALSKASENLPFFQDGTFAPTMHPHRLEPTFLAALRNPKIVKIMEQLVSGRVYGIQSQFFFCQPGTPGFTMHQDNNYIQAKSDAFASAWTALQDVTPENGGLTVYPGTHREPLLPVEVVEQPYNNVGKHVNVNYQQSVLPAGYEPVDLFVPKGATLFVHGHLVHSSNQNRSNQFRKSLAATLYSLW